MNLLSMEDVEKTFGRATLFAHATIGIDAGDRIGLVGRNGCGKSVLLQLLSGEIEPGGGTISRNRLLRIATLEQNPTGDSQTTLENFLYAGTAPHIQLSLEYRRALTSAGESTADSAKLTDLTVLMEETGGFTLEDRYLSLLAELGMGDPSVKIGKLSGGMLRKAAMARCLAGNANLLLLDEPTNHLDIDTIEWLETYLRKSEGAFVLVTHDRYFLESVCTTIFEIDDEMVYKYVCGYTAYLERKQLRYDSADAAENRRRTHLALELKWLRRGARARTGKAKARKDRYEQLSAEEPKDNQSMGSLTSAHRRLGKKVLELNGISKSYGEETVVAPYTYSFQGGERIGIIGANGSGKSTFLDIVAGTTLADAGKVVPGDNTAFAYFHQSSERDDAALSVIEYIRGHAEQVQVEDGSWITAEQFLERFLFPRSMFNQTIQSLSGGEYRRLFLLRLLASSPNFLLLDEPTNDLDIDTIRLLEEYLTAFRGCVVAVSHDRAFLDRVTDSLFVFQGEGKIQKFVGNYSDFAYDRSAREAARQDGKPKTGKKVMRTETTRLSFREIKELESLPVEMEKLEKEKATLEATFQDPDTGISCMDQANERYALVSESLERKSDRWLELAERADE